MFFLLSPDLRAPLSVRCTGTGNNGPGSEYSLPPSYRARNNLLRIPNLMSGHHPAADTPNSNGNHNNNGSRVTATLANVNESPIMGTITETRAIITSANQRHQQQMQQQQQQEQNRNSGLPDANDIIVNDAIANSTKIIQSCNDDSHTGILADVLPMLAKQSPISTTTTTASTTVQSKLSNASTDLHDIDRLFLNSSSHATIGDNAHLMNNDVSYSVGGDTKANRNDLVTIVTISGCTTTESSTGEMDILAHL